MRRSAWLGLLMVIVSCARASEPAPLDRLALPTGMIESPDGRWLLITNGDWDRRYAESSLVALDLDALAQGLADPRPAGASLDRDRPCRAHADGLRSECDPRRVIDASLGVRLPAGAGNPVIDRPSGELGPARLLIPTRIDPTLSWVDVYGPGFGGAADGGLRLDCGQDDERGCDRSFRVVIADDPARLSVDDQGYRFAYLPHLIGRTLTLIALDGEAGPAVVDVESEFFREDGLFDSKLGGGFAVVQRPCSVADDNAPDRSLDCTRPFLFASQRFWWGLRDFQVAPGLDVLISGREETVLGPNVEAAEPRPLMGGLAFEDPERGDRLLVVHVSPPALSRVDTSLDERGQPLVEVLDTVGLCNNPNVLVVHRPASGPRLAFVSCYADDAVAVVDLGIFAVIATLAVGDGPNELLIDPAREWLLVANTSESSISLIELSPSSPAYLHEFATLGLGTPTRAPS
ncbi:YncE family protein [Nannocystaceae bacterium ST9]